MLWCVAAPSLRFLVRLESGYQRTEEVPYHCAEHGASVMQFMHMELTQGGLLELGYADPLAHLACLIGAAAHGALRCCISPAPSLCGAHAMRSGPMPVLHASQTTATLGERTTS